MSASCIAFDRFLLDVDNRRLSLDGAPVELNGRYFDALVLLVEEHGRLVSKDRFLAEVWRGVPVTDEALTQCIRTLRRALGDDAAHPRFIETVPKHGYRFIAAMGAAPEPAAGAADVRSWRRAILLGVAGTAGGGAAGLLGGLLYGFVGAAQAPAAGAASAVLVVVLITAMTALVGAAGVAFGVAAFWLLPGRSRAWRILGGALGGMAIGAVVKLLGIDAFDLLFGRAPTDMTGAPEGFLLGGGVGVGAWFAGRATSLRLGLLLAAAAGATSGALVSLFGGRLMAGSLDVLADGFPESRLRLDAIGVLLGEAGFGPLSRLLTASLEGALFAACIVGAMTAWERRLRA